jgi:hypothetical protein
MNTNNRKQKNRRQEEPKSQPSKKQKPGMSQDRHRYHEQERIETRMTD